MSVKIREYNTKDIEAMIRIWNEVVEEGVAFPQEEYLIEETGAIFFGDQTYCAVAEDSETQNNNIRNTKMKGRSKHEAKLFLSSDRSGFVRIC